MNYKLISEPETNCDVLEQVLINRGVNKDDLKNYFMAATCGEAKNINSPETLGITPLEEAASALLHTISGNKECIIIVDCDYDGFGSSALLTNYLHDLFPSWTENHVTFFLHDGKQHGLADFMSNLENMDTDNIRLIITPDSSSNDYDCHKKLKEKGITVLILDHHEADKISDDAIVINNQLSDYPNKSLAGTGVTWQFCRYIDSILDRNNADKYIDIVGMTQISDMMDLRNIETRTLVTLGTKYDNLENPFIAGMADKNAYSLRKMANLQQEDDYITPMGAAFYIVPLVNATIRSGTMEEKRLLFDSMLNHKAFTEILSNKRGHKLGEKERVIDQALRMVTNVKNRQTKAEKVALEYVDELIEKRGLWNNKVLLFLLDKDDAQKVPSNIGGLVANRIMGKYQRPCCMLREHNGIFSGSARGCQKADVSEFKDLCEETGVTTFTAGHQGAFGLGIKKENIDTFINKTNTFLKDMPTEPKYYVDFVYTPEVLKYSADDIIRIGNNFFLWGQNIDEPYIAIKDLKISKQDINIYEGKTNTLKITLPQNKFITFIKFNISDEEMEIFNNIGDGYIELEVVGRCSVNKWQDKEYPQIMIENYNIVDSNKYYF